MYQWVVRNKLLKLVTIPMFVDQSEGLLANEAKAGRA
jgi:hypothetical protein